MPQPKKLCSVLFTQAQRKIIAGLVPELAPRLKLDEPNQRAIALTLDELRALQEKANPAIRQVDSGLKRNSLRRVVDIAAKAIEDRQGIGSVPASERLYQFRITLRESEPPIWRRIQVKNCTLDRLHEHIQTAMGWTNSHLNQFKIGERRYGDPMLMEEDFEELNYEDSTSTKLSEVLPKSGRRFSFEYEYDFGDGWEHEVLFEGVLRAEPGKRYPLCLEGERACPPEDVGGVWGYVDFLEAIQNPQHEEHDQMLAWVGGKFDPEAFDPETATKRMRRGLPDWRTMA